MNKNPDNVIIEKFKINSGFVNRLLSYSSLLISLNEVENKYNELNVSPI